MIDQPVSDPRQLALTLAGRRGDGVALVPTMGALHAGHLALVDRARSLAGTVVMSVFVNPLQFGPGEDFGSYPRRLAEDLRVADAAGVDLVFAPTHADMYPHGHPRVMVDPGPLGQELEGASRPGHFGGVLTVVARLFGLVRPEVAVFGEKDYQQLVLIRQLVEDLALRVRVEPVPTVRGSDGLAASSRNAYLSEQARLEAAALPRALRAGAEQALGGPAAVLRAATQVLDASPGLRADYLALRAPDLSPAPSAGAARLLAAIRVGGVRLIDNLAVQLGGTVEARPTAAVSRTGRA